jgi:hypothetical protein
MKPNQISNPVISLPSCAIDYLLMFITQTIYFALQSQFEFYTGQ